MGLVEDKYDYILNKGLTLGKTSSILDPKNNSLTFARSEEYLLKALKTGKSLHVVVPHSIDRGLIACFPNNVKAYKLDEGDSIEYVFTYIHNIVNEDKEPAEDVISPTANIHPTAVVGVHGNTYCDTPEGGKINLKHMGNVIIEDDVDIEALSIVHRAGMTSTILRKGAKICVMCNIGHNCYIGENTFIAPGVMLGGGAKIGSDCYLWQGVHTRSNISICDNVVVGMGSMVLHDITKPGVYYGNPAEFKKPYHGEWLR